METTPDTSDWQKRYTVIEKAYCEGRWGTVMEAGSPLLRELLEAGGAPEVMALRYRMQLLMAHTLLHGYGDRDAAEDLYEVVRRSDAEPSLRQIAEDGLDQCDQPLLSKMPTEEDEEEDLQGPSRPLLFLPESERTALEEEMASAAVAKAAGAAQLPLPPVPTPPVMPTAPAEEPAAVESPPGVAASELPTAPDANPFAGGPSDQALVLDPFQQPGSSVAIAAPGGAPVMPWLPQAPTVAIPAAETAASPQSRAKQKQKAAPQSKIQIQALIPDVVEEPELMEVHQSLPWLAEEVEVPVQAVPTTSDLSAGELSALGASDAPEGLEEEELRRGLLLVVLG